MQNFKHIIELWPTVEALAGEIGEKPTTVRKWYQRNSIPAQKWKRLLAAGRRRQYEFDAELLINIVSDDSSDLAA